MVKTKPIKPKEKRTIVSNKKKDRDQFIKEMDMLRLKQKINEIMKKVSNDKSKIENDNIKYKKNIQLINEKYTDNSNILYQSSFQNYIKNEFNLICISFVNKIILDIKRNHLEPYEGKYNFNKIFISLTKELLLNEFELVLLSLYLEYIDISIYLDKFNMEDSLLFLCYFIKRSSINSNELEPINSYLNKKYLNFNLNYDKWYKYNEKKINNKLFNYKDVNKRFREYNIPFSKYCRDNYIDYNYIVDRILTMSLPYVDVKKETNNTTIHNNSIVSSTNENNKNVQKSNNKINNENNNNNFINNNYFNNNYINNNYIDANKVNVGMDNYKNYNKQLIQPEPFINVNSQYKISSSSNTNSKNESINNSSYNSLNNKSNNNLLLKDNINNKFILNNTPPAAITPNNLLHSLNINRYMIAPENNKMLINQNLIGNINSKNNMEYPSNNYINLNKPNIAHSTRQIEEDFAPKKLGSNLIMNPLPTPSQSSFIFQQKPSLMEINLFNRNNSSHIFDDEGETLKQILAASSDNYFRSSMSFDSQKYPYGNYVNTGASNNLSNINNNVNNNIIGQKTCDNNNKVKYNNNDIPFRPLNIICSKNNGSNILAQNKIIYNNTGIDFRKNGGNTNNTNNTNITNNNNIIYFNKEAESNNIKKDN